MGRVNQPDTLVSELREIQRRLRLLEGGRPATVAAFAAASAPAAVPAVVAFTPASPSDWPGTTSESWTPLVRQLAGPGEYRVIVEAVPDAADSAGEVRVLADGVEVGSATVAGEVTRREFEATAASDPAEFVVEARRTDGQGVVRACAFLVPRS
jgi:hypothetical protein